MSNSTRAVFLDHASLDLGDLDLAPLRQVFGELVLHDASTGEQAAERLQGAQVAISNKVRLGADTLAACPELKLILVSATGTNNIDLSAARERGITVANCQGYGTASVAQHALMLLLALATRLPDYQTAVRAGAWQRASQFCLLDFPIIELQGKTLGILGHGELGGAFARLAEALGMVERAVAANPQSGAMVDSLGWAHYRLGDYKKAVDLLEQAVELEAGDPEINNHLGDAYWRVGRRIEAEYQWRRVLTLDPDPKIKADVEAKLASGQGPKGPSAAPRIAGQ